MAKLYSELFPMTLSQILRAELQPRETMERPVRMGMVMARVGKGVGGGREDTLGRLAPMDCPPKKVFWLPRTSDLLQTTPLSRFITKDSPEVKGRKAEKGALAVVADMAKTANAAETAPAMLARGELLEHKVLEDRAGPEAMV